MKELNIAMVAIVLPLVVGVGAMKIPNMQRSQNLSPPSVRLDGAPNFRDLGGHTTEDGRRVRYGRVFRSGQLSRLTESDYHELASLDIRYVYDLRSEDERGLAPTQWGGRTPPGTVNVPITSTVADPASLLRRLVSGNFREDEVRELLGRVVVDITLDAAPQFARLLSELGRDHVPAIVHCFAGEGRTGVFSALFLTLLDVPREQVMQDYLRSNDALVAMLADASRRLVAAGNPVAVESLATVIQARPEYLAGAFSAIDEKYGSFDQYRREALRIDDAALARLRNAFLE